MAGKTFRFSLDGVLQLRTHEADQARQALGQATAGRQAQEAAVKAARGALGRTASAPPGDAVNPAQLRRREAQRHQAWHAYEEAMRGLDQLRRQEQQARTRLQARHRAEESMRTLERRERAEHRRETLRAEANFLDEQATTGFQRRRRASDKTARLHASPQASL